MSAAARKAKTDHGACGGERGENGNVPTTTGQTAGLVVTGADSLPGRVCLGSRSPCSRRHGSEMVVMKVHADTARQQPANGACPA